MVMACLVLKIVLSLYTVWLIFLKIRFRAVLPSIVASVVRDMVQLMLSVAPVTLNLANVEYISIDEYLDPQGATIDFI